MGGSDAPVHTNAQRCNLQTHSRAMYKKAATYKYTIVLHKRAMDIVPWSQSAQYHGAKVQKQTHHGTMHCIFSETTLCPIGSMISLIQLNTNKNNV